MRVDRSFTKGTLPLGCAQAYIVLRELTGPITVSRIVDASTIVAAHASDSL
jgi:hypothetical protein